MKAHLHEKVAKRQKAWDPIHSIKLKPQHRRPDFVQNPGKWAKYSLADDGTNELKGYTGDQINKQLLYRFLMS